MEKDQIYECSVKWFHDGIFKDTWENKYLRLYSSGVLNLFTDEKDRKADLHYDLKKVGNFIYFGQETMFIPRKSLFLSIIYKMKYQL